MSSILEVKDVSVTLDNIPIIENISFDLATGESLAIIGPNGSGKTVLLKAILNLLPHTGEITWAKDTRIGYVPQKIDADRHLPITLNNLLEAKRRTLKLKVEGCGEACKIVGLTEATLETPVGHLSGGQFQKGLLALALLGDPKIIILDEPTASLDQPSEEHIYELIHRLQDKLGLSIIIVSHDLSMVYRYSEKVLCINKQGICFGDPHKVLDPKTLEELFGGPFEAFHHLHRAKLDNKENKNQS